jgi:hypothetical protein
MMTLTEMKKVLFSLMLSLFILDGMAQRYVFYLHGRILEVQGRNAVETDNGFGPYKYDDILDSLRKYNFEVISEVRQKNTDVNAYAELVSKQIGTLLKKGVPAGDITVIGASKGALIAMLVSGLQKNRDLNFIFLAACSEENLKAHPINFWGNILSVYEKSDYYHSCADFKKQSTGIHHYKEIEINTGLKHGFLYRPLPEWLHPAIQWASGKYN